MAVDTNGFGSSTRHSSSHARRWTVKKTAHCCYKPEHSSVRFHFPLADGGRLLESSRCREDIAPLFNSLPGRLFGDAEVPPPFRAPKPPLFPPRFRSEERRVGKE